MGVVWSFFGFFNGGSADALASAAPRPVAFANTICCWATPAEGFGLDVDGSDCAVALGLAFDGGGITSGADD